jgi:hypothetical protein
MAEAIDTANWQVEIAGGAPYLHTQFSEKHLIITGSPLDVAMAVAVRSGAGKPSHIDFDNRALRGAGTPAEHFAADFNRALFNP